MLAIKASQQIATILKYIDCIRYDLEGKSREVFLRDQRTQRIVTHSLRCIAREISTLPELLAYLPTPIWEDLLKVNASTMYEHNAEVDDIWVAAQGLDQLAVHARQFEVTR